MFQCKMIKTKTNVQQSDFESPTNQDVLFRRPQCVGQILKYFYMQFNTCYVLNNTFILTFQNSDLNENLKSRQLSNEFLTKLFNRKVSNSFIQKRSERKISKKDFKKILEESPYFSQDQTWELQLKTRRKAKCASTQCSKELKSGDLRLCVSGALSIPFKSEKAVLQTFYFCPQKKCLNARPPWTNIKPLQQLDSDGFVTKDEFNRIIRELGI